ncbi:GNAT family N-acetyltransferase [Nocardia goodfellowii]
MDADDWEARITRYTRSGRQILVVAEDPHSGSWSGMAGGFVDSERDSGAFVLPNPPVQQSDRWAMVWGTYVAPECRRQGMADRLCESLYTWAAEQARVDWLGLHVRDSNSRAIQLYERQRFHVVGRDFHPALEVTSLVMVRPVLQQREQPRSPASGAHGDGRGQDGEFEGPRKAADRGSRY